MNTKNENETNGKKKLFFVKLSIQKNEVLINWIILQDTL